MEEGHRQGSAAKDVSSLALSLTLLSGITAADQPAPPHPDQQVGPTFFIAHSLAFETCLIAPDCPRVLLRCWSSCRAAFAPAGGGAAAEA